MELRRLFLVALAVATLLGSSVARADIVTYTDRNAFLAATSNTGTDTFADIVPLQPYGNLNRTAGAYNYSVSGSGGVLYGAGTASDPWLSTNWTDATMTFSNFSGGVNALGGFFFGTDLFGNFTPHTMVTLTANDGSMIVYNLTDTTTSSFIGFISSSPLVSVMLSNVTGQQFWPVANDLVLGMAAPVPEPATYAMLLCALPLLGLASRRRVARR
jgi:hypothetical protein